MREGSLSIGGSTWRLPDNTVLDVRGSDQPWARKAIQNPNLSPHRLPIIPWPYLVVMKLQASRSQDLSDISRMLGGASETTLQEARKAVQNYCTEAVEDLESLIQIGKLERRTRKADFLVARYFWFIVLFFGNTFFSVFYLPAIYCINRFWETKSYYCSSQAPLSNSTAFLLLKLSSSYDGSV